MAGAEWFSGERRSLGGRFFFGHGEKLDLIDLSNSSFCACNYIPNLDCTDFPPLLSTFLLTFPLLPFPQLVEYYG